VRRTILHVFKKDVRRLWKEIAVTLLLLADLAWMDRWRTDSTPGSAEGWLNLLLPLAWAFLIARVIHEDPLANPQGWWWTIPSDIIDTAELEISPERAAGCTVIRYDFPDVSLSRFAIKPGR
jgi:hypothetical protein